MNPKVEIFSQGEEVVTGQVADTNAAWLSTQLVAMGFKVSRHNAVGDKLDDLIALLKEIANRADCCICTGGLGPTTDDLTREAVAMAFDSPLVFDEIAFENISRFFKKRQNLMPEVNRKQAFFPEKAKRINNDWGTAPAFSFKTDKCLFVFMAGVPFEMKLIFTEKVKSDLEQCFSLQPQQLVIIKTFGMGESDLQVCLDKIKLPDEVELSFRAGVEENQVKLLFPNNYPLDDKTTLVENVAQGIGDNVFAIDGLGQPAGNLIETVANLLNDNQQTLASIETMTQGLFAAKCIGHSWLLESTYCLNIDTLKQKWNLETETDLSTLASSLANKLQQQSGADFALVQIYSGTPQQLNDKDFSSLLYNTLLTPQGIFQQSKTLNGTIERKQHRAAMLGLDFLRRYLQHKTL